MEGYFNIAGPQNAFDDFDIEGKKSFDEEKRQNESKFKPIGRAQTTEEADKARLLDLKVDLDNGAVGYVFSVTGTGYNAQWKCHVCDMVFMGIKNLLFHERSMNHSSLMQASKHHASQFMRMEMRDGEPGPPGVDEDEETEPAVLTNIQTTLDEFKSSPLIGLEYVVELNEDYEKESAYVCMLCDKKGDPRTVMAHLVSYNHRLKYLERHFPVTYNAINSLPKTVGARKGLAEIVLRIATEMEEKLGRLRPVAADGRHFEENRFTLMCSINKGKHFIETPDKTFVHLVDRELLTSAAMKTDEIPIPDGNPPEKTTDKTKQLKEDDDEIEFQGAFVKGTRVPMTRQLRIRKFSVEGEDKTGDNASKSQNKPASENKKDDDAKSQCSLSSISSASSSPRDSRYKRSRYSRSRSRSRSGSRTRRRRRSRSYSRGRYRRTKSRSRSRSRRSRSPYGGRRRQRSPRRTGDSKREDDKKRRSKDRGDDLSQEKAKWEKFREEVAVVEKELLEKLAHHEKSPEKHPQYPEEWKLFWNKRYKELQVAGKDPNKHDFKPEWIEFWNRRMRDLHEQDFMKKKEEIREKLGLPVDDPKPHFNRRKKFIRDSDGHLVVVPDNGPAPSGKARSRSPSPWEEGMMGASFNPRDRDRDRDRERDRERERERERDREFGLYRPGRTDWRGESVRDRDRDRARSPLRSITVLRMLTALEQQLGSLGPRVNGMLSEAIALEKMQLGNSDVLLRDNQVVVLFETVKEKFKGQLLAGIVERNMVAATRNAIGAISELLYRAPPPEAMRAVSPPRLSRVEVPAVVHVPAPPVPSVAPRLPVPAHAPVIKPAPAPPVDPVTVPGVGAVDKAAIAKEIAMALVMQGRTDVTEQELEQLVAAVVGMAQAKAQAEAEAQQMSAQAAPAPAPVPQAAEASTVAPPPTATAAATTTAVQSELAAATNAANPGPVAPSQPTPEVTGLQLLQSAYNADEAKSSGQPLQDQSAKPTAKVADKQEVVIAKSAVLNKSPAKAGGSGQNAPLSAAQALDAYVDELTETDLRLLLQSFKDLPLDEQHGLIRYLKKLESTDPVRVERLRKYVNLGTGGNAAKVSAKTIIPPEKLQALAKVGQSGRLSPFSSRQQSRNPTQNEPSRQQPLKMDSDSDDDYSFDDVCKAAKQKVNEQEAIEAEKRRAIEKVEEEKKRKEQEELDRRLQQEKAKAQQALQEIEDREREQQRIVKEKERLEREAAMKVGAANWTSLNSNPANVATMNPSVPPPSVPPPPIPPSAHPATMQNMYGGAYGDMSGAMGNFNGGAGYYQSNTYNQYQQADGGYDQQSAYYQNPQANNGMYQQQAGPYSAQGYGGYGNNTMYQQLPGQQPQGQQSYPVAPYANQYRY